MVRKEGEEEGKGEEGEEEEFIHKSLPYPFRVWVRRLIITFWLRGRLLVVIGTDSTTTAGGSCCGLALSFGVVGHVRSIVRLLVKVGR